jgi:hypothetical protein
MNTENNKTPIKGQISYCQKSKRLKVYNGNTWETKSSPEELAKYIVSTLKESLHLLKETKNDFSSN